ncbi:MAG TPA: SDR family NAD(P)-dependent oxidoreductase [Steroidobacteraceae bacterium]|nr:SDR family NAD(P)-dependent oxidoreductase [Steroidobacteraceae bacterium]
MVHDVRSEESSAKPTASVVWIAGVGASAGLGAALGRRFAKAGLTVALTGRDAERVRSVAAEIEHDGYRAVAVPGDVSSAGDVARLTAEVQAIGVLGVGIFNAGNAVRGAPLDITPEQFELTWRGSTYAGFLFARSVLPPLLAAGTGTLLFTGATASLRGRGPFVAFAAAKAGLRSLAQSVAREYGPRGVHVAHIVIDGGIDGERLRSALPKRAADARVDELLNPDAVAETYWQLHLQHRSAWTHELDLRPYKESF